MYLSDAKRVQFKIDFWSSESQNDGMKAVVTSFFAGTKTTLVERRKKREIKTTKPCHRPFSPFSLSHAKKNQAKLRKEEKR